MNYPSIGQNMPPNALGAVQSGTQLKMREGQVFHGKIQQLFPGEMAEVQIGSQKMHAKLEVPLKAGDSYYFQVKATEPELQLKIISGPHGQKEPQSAKIDSLLETMQLPKTPQMRQLAESFIQQQLPMTKEALLAGEALLKQTSPAQMQAAVQSIGKLTALKLPVTPQLFQAMMGVETKEGLHSVLGGLQTALEADPAIPADGKQEIRQLLQQLKLPLLETNGARLFALTIRTALDSSAQAGDRFQAVQLLKTSGVLPAGTSLANLPEVLAKLVTQGSVGESAVKPGQQFSAQTARNAPQAMPGSAADVQAPAAKSDSRQVLALLQQADGAAKLPQATAARLARMLEQSDLPPAVKTQAAGILATSMQTDEPAASVLTKLSRLFFTESTDRMLLPGLRQTETAPGGVQAPFQAPDEPQPASSVPTLIRAAVDAAGGSGRLAQLVLQAQQSDSPAIQTLAAAAEGRTAEELTGHAVKQAIQTVLTKLGVNYEAGLATKEPDIQQIQDSLKPHLVALLQNSSAGPALREAAEAAVSRLNGPPLQSVDTGAQQQIIMQLPLTLQGSRIDATLEWNGRLKDDGKIDPDHARVLFYLDLEALKKTVVDMQVQNKVITLTIFNGDPRLQSTGQVLQGKLEEGLEEGGYKLSAVRFKPFREEDAGQKKLHPSSGRNLKGVDFRI
ncbi:hypothetical protein [Sporosarcina trichiuri]|uniref:hypothetical protein n=1 Tax=Sporosarcina trichiuri TaxID=3056445 RepID=UPI0025B2F109|nr:hypothetical protein [Sporosarcina sp. 0.2-SM1T-5]WJY28754.1 hypothetical protein QWT68_07150 [Sporosarcina sp. 0.2-SM1T-5]